MHCYGWKNITSMDIKKLKKHTNSKSRLSPSFLILKDDAFYNINRLKK